MQIKDQVCFLGAYSMCFIVPMSSNVKNMTSNIDELFLITIKDVLYWEYIYLLLFPVGTALFALMQV